MKKLLLILLCLPMIGFGQDDCGEKPKKPPSFGKAISVWKTTKEYKKWIKEYNVWKDCKEIYESAYDSLATYNIKLPVNEKTNLISFERIIKSENRKKEDLYFLIKEWFVITFNKAEAVLHLDDQENGKIIGKGWSELVYEEKWGANSLMLHFTITTQAKNGRVKVTITNLMNQAYPDTYDLNPDKNSMEYLLDDKLFKYSSEYNSNFRAYRSIKTSFIVTVEDLIDSLEDHVVNHNEDW